MSQNQALIAELKMESANTRKILSRVPMDKADWRAHPKSMTIGRTAVHIAELNRWAGMIMATDELDLGGGKYSSPKAATTEELLAALDEAVAYTQAELEKATDEDFSKMWTLRYGDHVILTLPRNVVIRTLAYSHSYHHRGQLSVYLRLLDVAVPSIYGPTADEQ